MYRSFFKRLIDILVSGTFLLVFSWLYFILYVLVRLKLGSPVFFTQPRPGLHGKIFNIYKFRTMTDARDEQGELLPDEVRLTPFGKTLRSTSLDELPEIWNIFIGDMSIVGPRPLLVDYLPYYTERERRRHDILPGLTGWAQINGRNVTPWDVRLEQDVYYVENYSFFLDCKIIWRTFFKVVRGADILVGAEIGRPGSGRLDVERRNKVNL